MVAGAIGHEVQSVLAVVHLVAPLWAGAALRDLPSKVCTLATAWRSRTGTGRSMAAVVRVVAAGLIWYEVQPVLGVLAVVHQVGRLQADASLRARLRHQPAPQR